MNIFTTVKLEDLILIKSYLKNGKNVNGIDFNGMIPLILVVDN